MDKDGTRTHFIPYSSIGILPPLTSDYLAGKENITSFYGFSPKLSSFKEMINQRFKKTVDRDLLQLVLREQYANFGDYKKINDNISSLINHNTFTVTTGQQLCLFTGPLYFIYKIISTINLAEALAKEYPENKFVPLFWMVSEDHDVEEMNHCNIFGKKISWHTKQTGATGSFSTEGMNEVIGELSALFGEQQNGKELIALFEEAYTGQSSVAGATRHLLAKLFGKWGLVAIDPSDSRLKSRFSEVIKDELENHTSQKIVTATNERLVSFGYKPQVNPQEINIFYIGKGFRERIISVSQGFSTRNDKANFSNQEIFEVLANHPERFSPNVVLRPLYQETILPNVAYIGGSVELSYWLQLKNLFEHYHANYPILVLRNSALLLDEKSEKIIRKLGFSYNELFETEEILIKKFITRNSGKGFILEEEKFSIKQIYTEISKKTKSIDPTLVATVEAEMTKTLKSLEHLESRIAKAIKSKSETEIAQIKKLKEKLFPNGILQERHENFTPYFLRYGKEFIEMLKNSFVPLSEDLSVIELG